MFTDNANQETILIGPLRGETEGYGTASINIFSEYPRDSEEEFTNAPCLSKFNFAAELCWRCSVNIPDYKLCIRCIDRQKLSELDKRKLILLAVVGLKKHGRFPNIMSVQMRKLSEVLNCITDQAVEYVLVGEDTARLKEDLSGDVDIVVRPESIEVPAEFIQKICESCRVVCVQILQHEVTAFYFVVSWEEDGEHQFLKLDICSDYYSNARFLLGANRLLSNRYKELESGFYYPAPEDNFLYYLIKKVDKGSISTSNFDFLIEINFFSRKLFRYPYCLNGILACRRCGKDFRFV